MRFTQTARGRFRRRRAAGKTHIPINLVSLIDVLTTLVFFLLVTAASIQTIAPPPGVTLPPSRSIEPPHVVTGVVVTKHDITIGGSTVMALSEITQSDSGNLPKLRDALQAVTNGAATDHPTSPRADEVNILADKDIPFSILRQVIATCATVAGFSHVSLSVAHIDSGA